MMILLVLVIVCCAPYLIMKSMGWYDEKEDTSNTSDKEQKDWRLFTYDKDVTDDDIRKCANRREAWLLSDGTKCYVCGHELDTPWVEVCRTGCQRGLWGDIPDFTNN